MSKTNKISGIYLITCKANNKVYVGSSKDIKHRWRGHRSLLNRGKHSNSKLQASWNSYGEGGFSFSIYKEVSEERLLQEEENAFVTFDVFNREKGYNLARTASCPFDGRRHTEETKLKQSEGNSGSNHWNYGKKQTKEHRNKISKAHRKFNDKQEDEIYSLYLNGTKADDIAELFKCNRMTIYRVLHRVTRNKGKKGVLKKETTNLNRGFRLTS